MNKYRKHQIRLIGLAVLALVVVFGLFAGGFSSAFAQQSSDDNGAVRFRATDDNPAATNSGEVEFWGTVASISPTSLTAGEFTFSLNAATEIKGSPQVGDRVKVHVINQADGSLLAREVELVSAVPAGQAGFDDQSGVSRSGEVQFYAAVKSISGSTWVIGTTTVVVNAQTFLKGAPVVGSFVEVEGIRQSDGTLLASKIAVEDSLSGSSSGDDTSISGDDDDSSSDDHSGSTGHGSDDDDSDDDQDDDSSHGGSGK